MMMSALLLSGITQLWREDDGVCYMLLPLEFDGGTGLIGDMRAKRKDNS
jgi:hypothetical protein